MAYANQKQLDKGLYWCQKHIESTPLDPRIYYLQATILQELKRVDDAIASLKKALFLDSDFIMAHFELGSLLLQKKRMKEGQKYLRNALTLLEAYPPDASLPHTDGILARHLKDIILNKKL
jgi:chemotaxis protein methyltransferase CheR